MWVSVIIRNIHRNNFFCSFKQFTITVCMCIMIYWVIVEWIYPLYTIDRISLSFPSLRQEKRVSVCVCVCMNVCMCVYLSRYINISHSLFHYIYICVCVCVCVHVCICECVSITPPLSLYIYIYIESTGFRSQLRESSLSSHTDEFW